MNAILDDFETASDGVVGTPVVVPLAAFYRRSDEAEAQRLKMYDAVERLCRMRPARPLPKEGRDGAPLHLQPSSDGLKILDAQSAPLEWLIFTDKLHDEAMCQQISTIRADAGFSFRAEMSTAEVSGLRSPDLLGIPSGASGPRTLSEFKLEAIFSIGQLREDMPDRLFKLLEAVVWHDEWVFRRNPKATNIKAGQKISCDIKVLGEVLCSLDCAAVHFHQLPLTEFRDRWQDVRYKPLTI